MYVLFDAWSSGESLLNLLNQFGWQYIRRVKKNRLFNGVRIDQTFRHTYGKTGNLKKIGHRILIVKDGERSLLTNNLELTSAEKGLYIFFLPKYSPHLNIAEIYWRKAKYEWLRPSDYFSFARYKQKIKEIFNRIGVDYKIVFKELKV